MTDNSASSQAGINISLFLQWVLACIAGYTIGMPVSSLAGERIGFPLWSKLVNISGLAEFTGQYDYIFAGALMGATSGGFIAISQWLVLRKYLQNPNWWIWIGLVGGSLGIVINSIFPQNISLNYYVPIFLTALLVGWLEWLVLRQIIPTFSWIATRVAIDILTLWIASINFANYPALLVDRIVNNSLMGLASGLVSGAISGLVLKYFIERIDEPFRNELQGK